MIEDTVFHVIEEAKSILIHMTVNNKLNWNLHPRNSVGIKLGAFTLFYEGVVTVLGS